MNLEYSEIFSLRGEFYNYAMNYSPNARKNEFEALFKHLPLIEGETILDVPAGGKYLKNFIRDDVSITSLEFTSGFSEDVEVVGPYENWKLDLHDRAISLASLHHISDLDLFLNNIKSSIKTGGILHLADVKMNSTISRFLDEFVGHWTVGGHQGFYRDWENIIWPEDLELLSVETRKCPWEFNSVDALIYFCKYLFYLRNCPFVKIQHYLENNIGIYTKNNLICLDWELVYIDLKLKPK
jgi:SAM-dependent methyltransferase